MTPPCMHCGEALERHEARGDERWCRDGAHTFNCVFHVNPELVDFLRAHPETPKEDLLRLWMEHLSMKTARGS
jgi:hypothetical protein